jgi:hypothetical protein
MAAPAAIFRRIVAAMLFGDHMFDVEAGYRSGRVRQVTVLAALASSVADEVTQGPFHGATDARFSRARALACRMPMKSMK